MEESLPNQNEDNIDSQSKSMIGLSFDSAEETYDFYNLYGRTIGFSVRKNQITVNKDKIITRRELTCSCQGFYKKKDTPTKPRAETRTGCQAMLEVRRNKENGQYVITKFWEEHNHELEPISRAHLLRSQRNFTTAQEQLIFKMREAGIGPAAIYAYFRAEAGGSEKVNFTRTDCNNLTQRRRADFLKEGDAISLLRYFKSKEKENKSFYYSIMTDEENRITGCFWCDAKSKVEYNFFGDVLTFDTTFNTNNYGMKCAPIAGVNNQGLTVLFGCGLLSNETTDSFVWLFNEFMEAMGGKHPQVIFTDRDQAMANAIKEVFPNTHHRLCLWHIFLNATSNLHVYKEDECFKKDLRNCIYNPETIEEFEEWWKKLLVKYNLVENEWLKTLYNSREQWAMVYARPYFCAGITTTQRSESVNNFLKKFTPRTIVLTEFMQQFDVVMANRRDKVMEVAKRKMPPLKTGWKIEAEASEFYTRKIFEDFQTELIGTIGLELDKEELSEDGTTISYPVKYCLDRRRIRKVTYVPSTKEVKCSCRKFEFTGVICGHVMKLLIHLQWSELPPVYYLNRWGGNAISGVVVDNSGDVIRHELDPALSARYSELSSITQSLVAKSAISVEVFQLAKTELLQATRKVDSLLASYEQGTEKTIQTDVIDHDQPTTETNVDGSAPNITVRNPVQKRKQGDQKGRKKSGVEKTSGKRTRKSKDANPTAIGEVDKEGTTTVENPRNARLVRNAQTSDAINITQEPYGQAYQEYGMMNGQAEARYGYVSQSQYGQRNQYAMMDPQAYNQRVSTNSLASLNVMQGSMYPVGYTSSNISLTSHPTQVSSHPTQGLTYPTNFASSSNEISSQPSQVYMLQDTAQVPIRRLNFGEAEMPNNFFYSL